MDKTTAPSSSSASHNAGGGIPPTSDAIDISTTSDSKVTTATRITSITTPAIQQLPVVPVSTATPTVAIPAGSKVTDLTTITTTNLTKSAVTSTNTVPISKVEAKGKSTNTSTSTPVTTSSLTTNIATANATVSSHDVAKEGAVAAAAATTTTSSSTTKRSHDTMKDDDVNLPRPNGTSTTANSTVAVSENVKDHPLVEEQRELMTTRRTRQHRQNTNTYVTDWAAIASGEISTSAHSNTLTETETGTDAQMSTTTAAATIASTNNKKKGNVKISQPTSVTAPSSTTTVTAIQAPTTTSLVGNKTLQYIYNLPPLPLVSSTKSTTGGIGSTIKPLTSTELQELEFILFDDDDNDAMSEDDIDNKHNTTSPTALWREDWVGNLAYIEKDIVDPVVQKPLWVERNNKIQRNINTTTISSKNKYNTNRKLKRQSLLIWIQHYDNEGRVDHQRVVLRYIRLLLQHVCTFTEHSGNNNNSNETMVVLPPTMKRILRTVIYNDEKLTIDETIQRINRVSYDPNVLQEDGWTIQQSMEKIGSTGGPYHIGAMIMVDNALAVVIAYIYDTDIGDLWKALYIDDLVSFDLETNELYDAIHKYNKKYGAPTSQTTNTNISATNKKGNTSTSTSTIAIQPDKNSIAVSHDTSSSKRQRSRSNTPPPNRLNASLPNATLNTTVDSSTKSFYVKGMEYGIVLAASYSKGARYNVYWPARIMHPTEYMATTNTDTTTATQSTTNTTSIGGGTIGTGTMNASGLATNNKRSLKQLLNSVNVVFLAPYWTSDDVFPGNKNRRNNNNNYDPGEIPSNDPVFMVETIDANDEMVKQFTFGTTVISGEFNINQLRLSFRFTGLPKSVFPRYVDAHRMALALQLYAKNHSSIPASISTNSVHDIIPTFPKIVLQLPFYYILSKLPRSFDDESTEPFKNMEAILNLESMVQSMAPPSCWNSNLKSDATTVVTEPASSNVADIIPTLEEQVVWMKGISLDTDMETDDNRSAIIDFMTEYPSLNKCFKQLYNSPPLVAVISSFARLLTQIGEENDEETMFEISVAERQQRLQSYISSWTVLKRLGEDSLAAVLSSSTLSPSNINYENRSAQAVSEWRRAAEKIYYYLICLFADEMDTGNGLSVVITDTNCNGHLTSSGCLERPVRLPAAIKGARSAGAGRDNMTKLITSVPVQYLEYVEQSILPKTHDTSYIKRMKSRCAAAAKDDDVFPLTDDSDADDEGGEDTMGSKGTWKAALSAVAVAIAATDMVVRGRCVNAFCIARPPGHHAGRTLHPMKAVSNGFCILNAVACAAIHATLPQSEGGLGLSRVCVIDFDAHHGNGTQDILCSTYDPRFLYISLHAGGSEINGHPMDDDPNNELHDLVNHPKLSGIFPGRCGDTSPHDGVLNIPLGEKVTSHAVGTALITQVSPRVEAFSPDLILLSAGFDAHKNDPMGLGALRAEDFGHITQVACELAFRTCSGRVVSVLEGGYGVPCCRPQKDIFLPKQPDSTEPKGVGAQSVGVTIAAASQTNQDTTQGKKQRPQPSRLLDLGDDIPNTMDDQVPLALQTRLEKCHAEGFVDCVFHHVQSLVQCNKMR